MRTLPRAICASGIRPGRALALTLALTCLAACGSNDSDDSQSSAGAGNEGDGGNVVSTFIACPSDTFFHLAGEVDGQAIDITKAPTTGGFSQQSNPPGPNFRVPNSTSEDDPQLVMVFLTWSKAVASGEVTPVEGSVRLPLTGPLPGQTLCAGAGSEMVIPPDDQEDATGEFQFRLLELAGGEDCSEPLDGELRGCWRN
jgi:hypothetical protein